MQIAKAIANFSIEKLDSLHFNQCSIDPIELQVLASEVAIIRRGNYCATASLWFHLRN